MLDKIKNWWTNYKLKKSIWSKFSDILFIIIVLGLLFPSSRMWMVSNFQRLTMWGPSELPTQEQVQISGQAYDWQLVGLDGKSYKLLDFKGKVIFMNFWATWCPPCVAEMPSIQKLYNHYKDNPNIAFILATTDKPNAIMKFLKRYQFRFPIYLMVTKTPQEFFSQTIPTTFLVDKSGKIIMKEHRAKKWHSEKTIAFIDELTKE